MGTSTLFSHNFSDPNEVRTFPKGHVELVAFQGVTVGRATFDPGWHWSESLKSIAGTTSCEAPHCGFVLSGHMHVEMNDGSAADFGPNDVMIVPPGHDAWTVGDEPCVVIDFSGMEHYAQKHD